MQYWCYHCSSIVAYSYKPKSDDLLIVLYFFVVSRLPSNIYIKATRVFTFYIDWQCASREYAIMRWANSGSMNTLFVDLPVSKQVAGHFLLLFAFCRLSRQVRSRTYLPTMGSSGQIRGSSHHHHDHWNRHVTASTLYRSLMIVRLRVGAGRMIPSALESAEINLKQPSWDYWPIRWFSPNPSYLLSFPCLPSSCCLRGLRLILGHNLAPLLSNSP